MPRPKLHQRKNGASRGAGFIPPWQHGNGLKIEDEDWWEQICQKYQEINFWCKINAKGKEVKK